MSDEFEDKTTEELHDMVEWFHQQGWEENAALAVGELRTRNEATAAELKEHGSLSDDELSHFTNV